MKMSLQVVIKNRMSGLPILESQVIRLEYSVIDITMKLDSCRDQSVVQSERPWQRRLENIRRVLFRARIEQDTQHFLHNAVWQAKSLILSG